MTPPQTHLRTIFSPSGTLAKRPHFEHRPQQFEMARAILDALESRTHLIVEAPTGVGKSLAYLIPALLHVLAEDRKAIVSTHTKHLQEQLIQKDIPLARSLLGRHIDAAVLKGRRNYLCTTRLRHALVQQKHLFEKEESAELMRINEWAAQTSDGDLENLPFPLKTGVWQQVSSEKGACSHLICGDECFFQQAKRRARQAGLVVMNHALFFTLLASQPQREDFLFEDDFVIFDEAHTLESVAGQGIGTTLSRAQVLFAIHRLYNARTKKGLLARLRKRDLHEQCRAAEESVNMFFDELTRAARRLSDRASAIRITAPHFVPNTAGKSLQTLQSRVRELEESEKRQQSKEELAATRRLLSEAEILIQEFLDQANPAFTYWVELYEGRLNTVLLHASPTDISESVGPMVFRENTSVILTSASLAINGSLDYFRRRIGALESRTMILESPFDFRRQMRLVIARNMPAPDEPGYEDRLPGRIVRSIERSRGRALVLFTSSALMKRMASLLAETIEGMGFRLLVQDSVASRHSLLEEFRKDVTSVLFGLDSFWMGIDVPGEALEHVIITRLPFAVPDHPLIQARIDRLQQQGKNAFYEFTLPEAVLKFRQGVGRLIRTSSDKGIVTVLDSRIVRRRYGNMFVRSIPRCPIEIVSADGEDCELDEP